MPVNLKGRHLLTLKDFTPEESARLSAIAQRFDRVNGEQAFRDCVAVILEEYKKQNAGNTDEELLSFAKEMKKNKGYGGN